MMQPINLFRFRIAFPACLMLGIALCAAPAPADQPTTTATPVAHWQKLPLSHVIPSQLLVALKWDNSANLPAGVTRFYALEADNSLLVEATPAGFAKVAEIVKLMDVAPIQVQVKCVLAAATAADLKDFGPPLLGGPSAVDAVTGGAAERLMAALTKRGAVVQAPTITTTSNVQAIITFGSVLPALVDVDSIRFAITPRVNSDNSVQLNLSASLTQRVPGETDTPQPPTQQGQSLQTVQTHSLRTVTSGDTLLLLNLFPGASSKNGTTLLLFVTPTVLSEGYTPAVK